jgi:DNA-binding protein YbaB
MTTPEPESRGGFGPLAELLAAARERLASTEVEASADGGTVHVTMDGERRVRSLTIDAAAMDATADELADLILAALGEAWERANSAKSSAIEGLIPGAGSLR